MQQQLQAPIQAGQYLMFDCPGQSELYMCHDAFPQIVGQLMRKLHISLTAVQLVDAHLCVTPQKYLAAALACLTSMLRLELPHVNLVSKVRGPRSIMDHMYMLQPSDACKQCCLRTILWHMLESLCTFVSLTLCSAYLQQSRECMHGSHQPSLLVQVDLLGKLSGDEVTDPEQLTDVDFLRHQLQSEPSHFAQRFAGLTSGLCDVIENYGLLTLTPVAVEQPQVLANAIDLIDRANGFNMSGLQGHNPYPEETKEQQSRLQQYLASGPSGIWSDAAGLADEKVGSQCTDALRRGDHAQD